jgi:hypothetical protein
LAQVASLSSVRGGILMKTRMIMPITILIAHILSAAGCAAPVSEPTATLAPAPQVSPSANPDVVLEMTERLNAGDIEGSLAYFDDEAIVYFFGLPPTGIEVYRGKDQIRSLWEDSVSNHFQWEIKNTRVNHDEIYLETQTWHDFTRQVGVAPLQYHDVYQVTNGKISTYGSWITGEALAKFKPVLAEILPPEPTATPSTAPPVSKMTFTIAEGACSTDNQVTLQAGELRVSFDVKDLEKELYALSLFNLDPGKDFLDLMASTHGLPPPWADILLLEELDPGARDTFTVTVEKGPVYVICWSKPPDLPISALGPFEVKE